MNFLSIREYFYKVNTIGFILLLVPILVFIFLYLFLADHQPFVSEDSTLTLLLIVIPGIVIISLTIVNYLINLRLQRIRRKAELAPRLDGFFVVSRLRMISFSACSLILAIGFFLTGSWFFTALFLTMIFVSVLYWPTRSSFCSTFDLQGMEKEMIMFDRDLR